MEFDKIIVFTDGSCTGNGKKTAKAGYGIYYPCSEFANVSEPFKLGPITNQRAELYAILKALETLDKSQFKMAYIYTDSLYSLKCLTVWNEKWQQNNWVGANKQPIKNCDILKPAIELMNKHTKKIKMIHINSHVKEEEKKLEHIFNDRADELATKGTAKN